MPNTRKYLRVTTECTFGEVMKYNEDTAAWVDDEDSGEKEKGMRRWWSVCVWGGGLFFYAEPAAKVITPQDSQSCKQIPHKEKEQRAR